MTIELIQKILLWCLVIHFVILVFWFASYSLAHGWIKRMHGRWYKLPEDQFDMIHYKAIIYYKIGVILFCAVPYLALVLAS